MRAALLISCLVLVACSQQPHHAEAEIELQQAVHGAIDASMRAQGADPELLPPTSRRRLRLRVGRLVGHAQDDRAAVRLILAGGADPAQLQRHSAASLERLRQRRHLAEPEPLHRWLMQRPLGTPGEQLLLRLLTRELIITYKLQHPDDWFIAGRD